MSFLNTLVLSYNIFFLIIQCYFIMAASPSSAVAGPDEVNPRAFNLNHYVLNELMLRTGVKFDDNTIKDRYKRQAVGGDKFKEAASSSSMKAVRQFLTMFKNLFSKDPSGGNHPMSKENPKAVVRLFKSTIYPFLFPEPGKAPKK